MARHTFRPLTAWTDPETPGARRRSASIFKTAWDDTLKLLATEADHLGADLVVVQVVTRAGTEDLRRDGMLKARAQVTHRGAVVSMETRHGPLRLATDAHENLYTATPPSWQANVHAIALSLAALRAVDRYGVTTRDEQYRGWLQLEAGTTGRSAVAIGMPATIDPPAFADQQAAAEWLVRQAIAHDAMSQPLDVEDVYAQPGISTDDYYARAAKQLLEDAPLARRTRRRLARDLHPERGGTAEDWTKLNEAAAILGLNEGTG